MKRIEPIIEDWDQDYVELDKFGLVYTPDSFQELRDKLELHLKHSEDPGGIMTCVGGLANYLSENFYLLPKRNFEKKKVEGLS